VCIPGIIPHSARIQEGRRAWGDGEVGAKNGPALHYYLHFGQSCCIPPYLKPSEFRHGPRHSSRIQMQRLSHPCAGVYIHPLQRQWRTGVHAAGRSQRGVPNLPRAASCGVCGNSKSGAMGSSQRRRPPCRLNLCAGHAGSWVHPRPVKRRSGAPVASVSSSCLLSDWLGPEDSSVHAAPVNRFLCLGRLARFIPAASPVRSIFLADAVRMLAFHAHRILRIARRIK
jgi:hypothetical protein